MIPIDTPERFRYPIGHFSGTSPEPRAFQIQTIRSLPARLASLVSDLKENQLDSSYRDGGWTVRQVVHHVADSHANAYIRMKLALTEDWPTIKPYDEAAWANLADSLLPVEVSLQLLSSLHARWVALLESLTDADFQRGYIHPGMQANGGRQTLVQVLALYDWHSRHHTAHIEHLRQRMGW